MGLAERRAAKAFEEGRLPTLAKEIAGIVGYDLTITMRWDSLMVDGLSTDYDAYWTGVYFMPLTTALKAICADAMGKDAIKAALKGVVIQDTLHTMNEDRWASIADGVLTLDHLPCTNHDAPKARTRTLQALLESRL